MQLQTKVTQLENTNAKLSNQLRASQKTIADLTNQLNAANENVIKLQTDLTALQASATESADRLAKIEKKSDDQFTSLGKSVSKSTLFWVIAFIVVACVTLLLNWQLKSKIKKEKKDITDNIKIGNEQMKGEFAGTLSKNSQELKDLMSGEVKSIGEKISSLTKSGDDLRTELKTNLKLATEAFDEQKMKLEAQIKNLMEETKKHTKIESKA